MSEEGQLCRNIAQQAMNMRYPSVVLTPAHSNDLEEWAKLFYIISKSAKNIEESTKIPISVDLIDRYVVECESSPNGFHEMADFENKELNLNVTICIHCGKMLRKTEKTIDEVKECLTTKKFSKARMRSMPRAPEDQLPF